MLHGGDSLSIAGRVLVCLTMLDKLLAGGGILALREPGKLLGINGTGESEAIGELPLPLPYYRLSATPIALVRGREFPGVIGLRLRRGERLGDGQHGILTR